MIIGLTGSIGMGKSAVAAMFADEGVPVFDADATVHRLQGIGGRLVVAIEAAFPGSTANGAVDRAKLGAAVFGDDAAIKRLEAIVHPAVGEERAAFLAWHAGKRVVFDVPLLFETGGDRNVDLIVVVSAAPDVQRARVLARPGMTAEKFAAILARQTPDAEKRARADHVIHTDTSFDATRAQVRAVLASLEI
ncbi:dephospho-CoA kinase [Sphingomonas sp. PP-CE-1G-424]|uniref:dephospho-CoA kinase n=1 Tax=Sphingomonas sp. PP-CE-1G-424 TaxID=2135658 RepID=UPI001056CE47|nr:dephospho-CoA kinase [Sphingomonas sp. PP-CE-1G-424]TCP73058.1 dephospho-CoA kinase [Sphingomonas sp. PP-CE-1G-424]